MGEDPRQAGGGDKGQMPEQRRAEGGGVTEGISAVRRRGPWEGNGLDGLDVKQKEEFNCVGTEVTRWRCRGDESRKSGP